MCVRVHISAGVCVCAMTSECVYVFIVRIRALGAVAMGFVFVHAGTELGIRRRCWVADV